MANENKKDFNKMLNDKSKQAKVVELDAQASKKWGGKTMIVAPPIDYDYEIKKIPMGKVVTVSELRNAMSKKYKTEITCPLTAGIFTNICAWASYQRENDKTPFWRVLKSNGELNAKFPEYPTLQKDLLEKEGFEIVEKNDKYFVKDYQSHIFIEK